MKRTPENGLMPNTWAVYFEVEDTDASAKELGGAVLQDPFDVPMVGRIAMIQDPQGSILHVITSATMERP